MNIYTGFNTLTQKSDGMNVGDRFKKAKQIYIKKE